MEDEDERQDWNELELCAENYGSREFDVVLHISCEDFSLYVCTSQQ